MKNHLVSRFTSVSVSLPAEWTVAIANGIYGSRRPAVVPKFQHSMRLGPAQHRRLEGTLKASVAHVEMPQHQELGELSVQALARHTGAQNRARYFERWKTKLSRLGARQWQNNGGLWRSRKPSPPQHEGTVHACRLMPCLGGT